MRVDLVASEAHFLDHVLPVYLALPDENRGRAWVGRISPEADIVSHLLEQAGVEVAGAVPSSEATHAIVASVGDLDRTKKSGAQVAFFEHGCGMSWRGLGSGKSSFVGSDYRPRCGLIVVPNPRAAARQRRGTPDIEVLDLGTSPRLDRWWGHRPADKARPVVAISFHWDSSICPEVGSALPYYRGVLRAAARQDDFELVGHAHPRISGLMRAICEDAGIRYLPRFDAVLAEADAYACDVSSTMYEAAAAGLQVLALNKPAYRRHVNHGLRFWELVPGIQCDEPEDLVPAIRRTLAGEGEWERRRAVAHVYPRLGPDGATRAAEAVARWAR